MRKIAYSLVSFVLGVSSLAFANTSDSLVKAKLELDRNVLYANQQETAVIKVTLDAPDAASNKKRNPVNLCIVLDRSGSMGQQKMEHAKLAAIQALRSLGKDDLFSLVIYDEVVETIVPSQSAANTEWIEAQISRISSRGSTALFGGVSQAAAEIRKNLEGNFIHRIILLSDGIANVGPSSASDLARLGASLIKENISVSTVGLGNDFNEDLMTSLAEKSNGNNYFVESPNDLSRIFADELGDVLSVVAKKVIIEVECDDGIKPVRVIGREARVSGNKIELNLNQLYGGQQKYALVEVQVPPGAKDVNRNIAFANIRYDDLRNKKQSVRTAHAVVSFSDEKKKVESSLDRVITKDIVLNQAVVAEEEAILLWQAGKKEDAQKLIKDNYQNLEVYAQEDQALGDYADELKELEKQVAKPSSAPTKKAKNVAKSRSYQTRTQQKGGFFNILKGSSSAPVDIQVNDPSNTNQTQSATQPTTEQ